MSAGGKKDDADATLARARGLAAQGRDDEAYASYLEVLSRDPGNFSALHELGCLAHAGGYRSAARTIYRRIVESWPRDLIGHVNLGNILYEDGDQACAKLHFETALQLDADAGEANRGLGRILYELGEMETADRHWRRSFSGQAIATQLYRGRGEPIPVLLLVSAKGGNVPTQHILDDRTFAVTTLYAEYYRPDLPLPPHALLFNAVGDADRALDTLDAVAAITRRSDAPLINPPAAVRLTGRAINAARLAGLPGVRAPRMQVLPRADLHGANALAFPLLLRAQGFHTGHHFVKIDDPAALQAAAAGLPGENLLAIEYLDVRGADGMARKYRVMCIGGALYPLHLAISGDWKVHYFTADMGKSAAHRAEEKRFLENMPGVLGADAMEGLKRIAAALALDYAGIDFAIGGDGSVVLFEANATMLIAPPSAEPIWEYRKAPIMLALEAARGMLIARSADGRGAGAMAACR